MTITGWGAHQCAHNLQRRTGCAPSNPVWSACLTANMQIYAIFLLIKLERSVSPCLPPLRTLTSSHVLAIAQRSGPLCKHRTQTFR